MKEAVKVLGVFELLITTRAALFTHNAQGEVTEFGAGQGSQLYEDNTFLLHFITIFQSSTLHI